MIRFNLPPRQRFIFFILIFALCFLFTAVIAGLLLHGGVTTPRARIATIVQDLLVFVLPVIVTALIITRQPADFLLLSNRPSPTLFLLVTATVLAVVPAMNRLIAWNQALSLPTQLAPLEEWMRQAEVSSQTMVTTLIGGSGVGSLIITLLIVGIMAGFCEELFFRGGIQQLFITSNMKPTLAIWLTAIIFSAVHMQFFGFFPRLLLGAYFGYLARWTQSLWPAIWAHTLNNLLAAYALWTNTSHGAASAIDPFANTPLASEPALIYIIISLPLTASLIFLTRRKCLSTAKS